MCHGFANIGLVNRFDFLCFDALPSRVSDNNHIQDIVCFEVWNSYHGFAPKRHLQGLENEDVFKFTLGNDSKGRVTIGRTETRPQVED